MTSIMKRTEKDSAVSPVVGVMLMLVVTIIIAAVVAAFAGGLISTEEKAPTAVLDIKIQSQANVGGIMSSTYAPDFTIDHLSGDALNTADLTIKFSWKNETGYQFNSVFDGSANTSRNYTATSSNYWYEYKVPLYINGISQAWGNASLTTGSHVQTGGNFLYQDYIPAYWGTGTTTIHKGSVFMDDLMGRGIMDKFTLVPFGEGASGATTTLGIMETLPVGTAVHVTIIHVPTNTAIYDKDVVVQ